MPSSMSSFLIGPCLIVIFPADSSILVTCPSIMSNCASAIDAGAATFKPNTAAVIRSVFCMRIILLRRRLFHDDLAKHPGFEMAGDQARVFELAALGELPNNF